MGGVVQDYEDKKAATHEVTGQEVPSESTALLPVLIGDDGAAPYTCSASAGVGQRGAKPEALHDPQTAVATWKSGPSPTGSAVSP